ncbi:hypothetical protein C2845_PM13G19360 [Panicum miliaceum]|uniref:Response regulatory domain-containing protein n=1 Tax=Panicum miliaceum TaxID=4540 RepID=A0A3L6RG98_PANMI|nr:hypothetical protein C2845_PM13G19360 [Panicum miliaceum]
MSTFFPNKIRVLVVDGDAKFLKLSSMVLSVLNYKVTTCGCPISALKVLTKNKLDAVLTNSVDAVACGFDFRTIVESNLGIPVLYFLPVPRKASGEEADHLLRRLPPATYAVREPPRVHDMRLLRRVIAWRKCCLEVKLKQAGRNRTPTAIVEDLTAGGSTVDDEEREDEEERVQFKVVKARGRGRKRKTGSNPGGSSGASSLAGDHPGQGQQQMNVTEGQERDNMASNQQQLATPPQERRGTRAKKNKGKASQQEPQAVVDGRQPGQQQQMSLLLQSLLHSLDVPPYNPASMFVDAAGPSNNVAACAGASNTVAPTPALPPPPVYPGPAPAPRPVYSAPAPMPPLPQVNPSPVPVPAPPPRPVMNPAPAPVPPVYPVQAPALPLAHQSLQPPMVQQGMFVPWSYGNGMRRRENGSIMLSFQQPPAGDFFTGIGSGGATFGASAAATPHAGANGNAAGSLLQSLNLLGADDHGELSAMATMYPGYNPPMAPQHVGAASNDEAALAALYSNNYCARSLMAPQHIGRGVAAANEAADIEALSSDGYINYNTVSFMAPQQVDDGVALAPGEAPTMEEILDSISFSSGSPLAPDQVLGMASDVNDEQTIAAGGGAIGGNAASFTPFQDLVVAAPNGNDQLAPGALDGDLNGSLMGSQGLGHGAAVDGDAGFAAMFPADQYEDDNIFSLEKLLALNDSPIYEAGLQLDGQQGGATGGAAAAAGTSLIVGAGGKGTWGDIGAAGNSDILYDDFILDDLWDHRTPFDVNNGRK